MIVVRIQVKDKFKLLLLKDKQVMHMQILYQILEFSVCPHQKSITATMSFNRLKLTDKKRNVNPNLRLNHLAQMEKTPSIDQME